MTTVDDDIVYVKESDIACMNRDQLFEHLNLVGELFTEELVDFYESTLRERALDHFEECRNIFVNRYYEQKEAITAWSLK
ncbi:MAG: hypothetical protein HOJ16_07700 [Candidatus Peribacter sp.]|nr:hypothetical protein [Candidatus Peribacter sp.]